MINSTTENRKAKPGRFARLVRHPSPEEPGLLIIFEGKHWDEYLVSELPSDWGLAYSLRKFHSTKKNFTPETYATLLGHDESEHECNCRGHERWGYCRHVSALQALIARGKLVSAHQEEPEDAEEVEVLDGIWHPGYDLC